MLGRSFLIDADSPASGSPLVSPAHGSDSNSVPPSDDDTGDSDAEQASGGGLLDSDAAAAAADAGEDEDDELLVDGEEAFPEIELSLPPASKVKVKAAEYLQVMGLEGRGGAWGGWGGGLEGQLRRGQAGGWPVLWRGLRGRRWPKVTGAARAGGGAALLTERKSEQSVYCPASW